MRKRLLSLIFDYIQKIPLVIFIISILFGTIFFLAFRYIPLKSDFIDLLPQQSEPVKNLRFLSEKLKGVGQFSIVIESESQDKESMMSFADEIYDDILNIPEVLFVNYKIPRDFIMKNFYFFMELADLEEIHNRLREKVQYEFWKDAPFYVNLEEEGAVDFNIDDIIEKYTNTSGSLRLSDTDYMISQDNRILVMFLKPDFMPTEVDKTGELIKKINMIIKKYDIDKYNSDFKISFAGTYTLSYDQKAAIYKDIKRTSILAIIFIFIAILFFIRNLRLSLFLLYALGIGVLSAFGIAYVTLNHLNLITGFLIAILTGLGVNYGIHFIFRYNDESRRISNTKALKNSFIKTGLPSLTGALTTAVSFFTLSFSRFLGFSEFGILASFAIIITLISIYVIVTALIVLTNRFVKEKKIIKVNPTIKWKKFYFNYIEKIIYSVTLPLIIITVILAFNIKDIDFEYNSKKLEVKGQESIRSTELIQQKFNVSTDPAIFYTYDRDEEIDFYNSVNKLINKENSFVGNILSLSKIISEESIQKEKISIIKKIRKELESLPEGSIEDKDKLEKIEMFKDKTKAPTILREDEIPDLFKRRFLHIDKDEKLYISQVFPKKVLFDAKDMREYVAQIKKVQGKIKDYFPTGMHILYVFLIDTVLKESKIFISVVFIIIWLLLLFDFKNFKDSLIAMIPLVFGMLWLVEIMTVFDIKFNFMNIVVLPTVLGTGVDNGVHIYHRYKETKNIFKAIYKTGMANFGMSLTVALGWSALFFANYQGLRTMAFVGVVGILMTFVASVTIMPTVILIFDSKRISLT